MNLHPFARRHLHAPRMAAALAAAALLPLAAATARPAADADNPAQLDWVRVGGFEIARTETTVGQFRRFVQATGTVTEAEHRGGGQVYELGWADKPGWTWATPFGGGRPAAADEPAVHLTWHEAQAFCRWAGGRLPRDAEWASAAYTEQRTQPPLPFLRGRTYSLPSGDAAAGQQCLGDCGPEAQRRGIRHGARLLRGHGHALAGSTPAGVNGLHEMLGNAWEWVDDPPVPDGADVQSAARLTRGGSWWYGTAQALATHRQTKPADTAVVYIGFRCARG
jgi:formylglycine-generating enzyme required for sulfatase activity